MYLMETQVACGGCHMIVTALPKLENGDIESEDEEIKEDRTHLNGTLKVNGSLELSGSFSARDRRRNAVSFVHFFCLGAKCRTYH